MATPSNAAASVHLLISGTVQGVGFRMSTRDEAVARGLAGWVKNLPDGRVEAVFEGDGDAVESIIRWCHQGPVAASVNEVTVDYQDPQGIETFEIRR